MVRAECERVAESFASSGFLSSRAASALTDCGVDLKFVFDAPYVWDVVCSLLPAVLAASWCFPRSRP